MGQNARTLASVNIGPLHTWRLNLSDNTLYIISHVFILPKKYIFHLNVSLRMWVLEWVLLCKYKRHLRTGSIESLGEIKVTVFRGVVVIQCFLLYYGRAAGHEEPKRCFSSYLSWPHCCRIPSHQSISKGHQSMQWMLVYSERQISCNRQEIEQIILQDDIYCNVDCL